MMSKTQYVKYAENEDLQSYVGTGSVHRFQLMSFGGLHFVSSFETIFCKKTFKSARYGKIQVHLQ